MALYWTLLCVPYTTNNSSWYTHKVWRRYNKYMHVSEVKWPALVLLTSKCARRRSHVGGAKQKTNALFLCRGVHIRNVSIKNIKFLLDIEKLSDFFLCFFRSVLIFFYSTFPFDGQSWEWEKEKCGFNNCLLMTV